jgi:tetratricopeptide (TPR) repeat protein
LETALRIKPDYAEALSNRATVLTGLAQPDRARASAEAALCLQPDFAVACSNRAGALLALGLVEEAMAGFETALRIEPDDAEIHHNLSLVRLMTGDFAAGWPEHEWRKEGTAPRSRPKRFPQPSWDGRDLDGRTLLLHAEQGFGDVLQFCRYAPLVAGRGGRVILQAPHPLVSLLGSLAGVEQVVADDETPPPFDLQCPLMSLPLLFGTRVETIPAAIPYLRSGEALRSREAGPLRVGLVWAGNPRHRNDRERSLPFAALAPLWSLAGIRWYSLQLGERRKDLAAAPAGLIEDLSQNLGDFSDTAAALSRLDLLLTVDTAVAHLAGALGCPAWVMLSRIPDWRWLLERSDSPWYPSLRLFRQAERGNWDDVVADIVPALALTAAEGAAAYPPAE